MLGRKKYQKVKHIFFSNKSKQLSETCAEIIGFLFREILNELLEASLEVKQQRNDSENKCISSNEIFEACRLLKLKKYSLLYTFNPRQTDKYRNTNKKCNLFN